MATGIASQIDALGAVRVGVHSRAVRGWSLAVDTSSRRAGALRETSVFAFGGYRVGLERGRFRAWGGLELGAGTVLQSLGETSTTGAVALAPIGGLSIALTPMVALTVEAHVPATLLKQDGNVTVVALPAAWLGVVISP